MSYAIIGFGKIGQALAKAFARSGIEVSVATTRDPESFASAAAAIGPEIIPKKLAEAVKADVVFLAVRFESHRDVAKALPTWTGKIIVDFVSGKMPAYLDTGLNVVDVRDVAAAHLAACERGRVGERYILGAENMTLRQIFEALAPVAGRKPPAIEIPYGVAYVAGVFSTAWANLTGQEPRAPLDGVKMARKKMWVKCDKAVRELGYQPGAAMSGLEAAVGWFQKNGYC